VYNIIKKEENLMDEKQRILKLLRDQVITIEEANILLDALKPESGKESKEKHENKAKEVIKDFEIKINKFSDDVGSLIKESLKVVEEKVEKIFKKEEDKK